MKGESSVQISYDNDVQYVCSIWRDDSLLPEDGIGSLPEPAPSHLVDMTFCNKFKKLANGDDDVIELASVHLRCCLYERGEDARFASRFVSLLRFPVSVKDSIVDGISQFAHSMLEDGENEGLVLLPFVVDVSVTTFQIPGESEDDAIARARAANRLQQLARMNARS